MQILTPEPYQVENDIGNPPKNDNFQVHHIHDGASWPVLIVEIWSPFHQAQGFSHDDTFLENPAAKRKCFKRKPRP